MKFALAALAIISLVELAVYLPKLWPSRGQLPVVLSMGLLFSSVWLTLTSPNFAVYLFDLFSLYRLINLARLHANRINEHFLRRTACRTSYSLIGLQILALAAGVLPLRTFLWLWLIIVVQLLTALTLVLVTRRNISKLLHPVPAEIDTSPDWPTLSVLIPARNETIELENCLQSLIASSYPKLEIIVLDDSSQNKRTPEIIRSFAQHGVRFIPGEMPPGNWLAKNFAYQELAHQANGDLLLLCGVDTQFAPGSLSRLVQRFQGERLDMLSVLPSNHLPAHQKFGYLFVQPLRYAWEIVLPELPWSRQPVLSTCWLIRAKTLQRAGGFAAASRDIIPEAYFAKAATGAGNKYRFVAPVVENDIVSNKSWPEQLATAIRTRYPRLHHRQELVALVSLAEIWFFVCPPATVVYGLLTGSFWLALAALIGMAFASLLNSLVVRLTYRRPVGGSFWLGILAGIYDISLLNLSMWRYEFGEVLWKGRNVCIPVLRSPPDAASFTSNSAHKL